MNRKLKLEIQEAINKVIEDNSEETLWPGFLHDNLIEQMTDAAELVFDSSIDGQRYAKEQE